MPDHLHLLVEGLNDESDLRRLIKLAKQRSGAVYSADHGTGLWQEGYYERVVRKPDDVMSIARYILENPVRAGLARRAQDYPFLGSDRWTIEQLIDSLGR